MRIGLFGGTFDPIHCGHLRAALEVKEGFDLDQIVLIPAAVPPHKTDRRVTNAAARLKMVELAVKGSLKFTVSDIELKRSGPSYSIDTIKHFKQTTPKDTEIYFISGLDAFLEIDAWQSYDELLAQISFIVINRPNVVSNQREYGWESMDGYLKSKISSEYIFSNSKSCYLHPGKQPIYVYDVAILDISSTKIRELIKNGRSIDYLVPQEVADFIISKGLYL